MQPDVDVGIAGGHRLFTRAVSTRRPAKKFPRRMSTGGFSGLDRQRPSLSDFEAISVPGGRPPGAFYEYVTPVGCIHLGSSRPSSSPSPSLVPPLPPALHTLPGEGGGPPALTGPSSCRWSSLGSFRGGNEPSRPLLRLRKQRRRRWAEDSLQYESVAFRRKRRPKA